MESTTLHHHYHHYHHHHHRYHLHRHLLIESSSGAQSSQPARPSLIQKPLTICFISLAILVIIWLLVDVILRLYRQWYFSRGLPTTPSMAAPEAGLSRSINNLDDIPVLTYEATFTGSSSTCSSFESETCSICLAEFLCGERVRVLPHCKHIFHKECIEQWLPSRSSFCPICRDQTIEQDVEVARPNCRNNGNVGNGAALVILNITAASHHFPAYM